MSEKTKLLQNWALSLTNSILENPECIETRELMVAHFELWGNRLEEELIKQGGLNERNTNLLS